MASSGCSAPDEDQGLLRQFLGQGEIAALSHQIRLEPWGKEAEKLGEGGAVGAAGAALFSAAAGLAF